MVKKRHGSRNHRLFIKKYLDPTNTVKTITSVNMETYSVLG